MLFIFLFAIVTFHQVVPGDDDCAHLAKARTSAHTRTLFPVFGETLDLVVPEENQTDSSLLLFSVKDLGPLGDSLPLGEALLPLQRVPLATVDASLVGVQEVFFKEMDKCFFLN